MEQQVQALLTDTVRENCNAIIRLRGLEPEVVAEMLDLNPRELRSLWAAYNWHNVGTHPLEVAKKLGLTAEQALYGFAGTDTQTAGLAEAAKRRLAERSD